LAVVRDDLHDKPGMQPLRVKLMHVAIERYEPFLKRSPDDPTLRSELGRLQLLYGFAANDVNEDYTNIVLPAYDTALSIQRQLVREQPTNRQYRFDLGWSLVFARLWHNTNGIATNQPEAISVFEGLLHDYPGDPFARLGLAWALGINTEWHRAIDSQSGARSQRRLALLEQLVKDYPHSVEFRRDLANQLSLTAFRAEIPADSQIRLDWMTRANKLRQENLAAMQAKDPTALEPWPDPDSEELIFHPTLLYSKFDLANGYRRQAEVLRELKRLPEALEMNDRAVVLCRELVEQNPSVVRFRDYFLVAAFKNGIGIAEEAGDKAGAESRRRAAEEFWKTHPVAQ
jgi:tetratricopeptide (TPR) repeat protein